MTQHSISAQVEPRFWHIEHTPHSEDFLGVLPGVSAKDVKNKFNEIKESDFKYYARRLHQLEINGDS